MKFKKEIQNHIMILKKNEKNIIKKSIELSELLYKLFHKKKKILIAGNGGSASDAQHIAAELIVRFNKKRIALPCLSLATDTSVITAAGNDIHFNKIFSRQIEGIGEEGDLFIAISTSGNSKNIINALKVAKKKNIYTFGIFGNKGGFAKKFCKNYFSITENNPSKVQEIHIIFYHLFCQMIENKLPGHKVHR